MRAIEAPMAPAPSSEASARRRGRAGDAEGAGDPCAVLPHDGDPQREPGARPLGRRARRAPGGGRRSRQCGRAPDGARPSSTSASVVPSRPAVGSSSRSRGASRTKARARATRWRSPADSPAPPSPSRVSAPSGNRRTTSVSPAAANASATAASDASGRPSRMFSATDRAKRWGRCGHPADVPAPVVQIEVLEPNPAEGHGSGDQGGAGRG